MSKKIRWMTETAVMLALLVALQTVTRPLGQLVTGSCVNLVLVVTVMVAGLGSGITVALISPVLAWALKIAPQEVTVPAIMLGNTVFVVLWYFIAGKDSKKTLRQLLAWIGAAVVKFAVLYAAVVWLICGVLFDKLLAAGTVKPPMQGVLAQSFSWPQLFTALIGGFVALLVVPVLRKALHR